MNQIFLKSNETMVVKGAPYNSLSRLHYSYCPFCESVENKFAVNRDGSGCSGSLYNCKCVHTVVITAPSNPALRPDVRVIYIGSFLEENNDSA